MPLLTIKDLLEGDPKEVNELIERASTLSDIYEAGLDADQGDGHLRLPGIHASEVSGCQRRLVYTMRGEPKTGHVAAVWKRRFKVGHALHDMFQSEFEKLMRRSNFCITFEREISISPGRQRLADRWNIHSSTDGVFTIRDRWDGPSLARVILEIKTESPDGFEKLKAPKPDHVEQAHVYMACLDVPLTWFLYFNKGNQNYTPSTNPSFFIRYQPDIWEKLESRFDKAHTHVALNTLPDRQESVLCEFCAYSGGCKPKYLERGAARFAPAPQGWKT